MVRSDRRSFIVSPTVRLSRIWLCLPKIGQTFEVGIFILLNIVQLVHKTLLLRAAIVQVEWHSFNGLELLVLLRCMQETAPGLAYRNGPPVIQFDVRLRFCRQTNQVLIRAIGCEVDTPWGSDQSPFLERVIDVKCATGGNLTTLKVLLIKVGINRR